MALPLGHEGQQRLQLRNLRRERRVVHLVLLLHGSDGCVGVCLQIGRVRGRLRVHAIESCI